jgi:malate synthase
MEDAATAEISRAQVWQWVRHGQTLQDGRPVTKEFVREIVREEQDKVKAAMGDDAYANGRYEDAAQLMIDLVEQPTFEEFLTLPAYERILSDEKAAA